MLATFFCGLLLPVNGKTLRQAVVAGVDHYGETRGLPNLGNAVADAVLVAGELELSGFR